MLIAKFGGSLIAPKNHSNFIDIDYLAQIGTIRNNINETKFLIHGGGNIGHGFIKQYGLSSHTYIQGRIALYGLNKTIDSYIVGTRIHPTELQFIGNNTQGSFICGGDIVSNLSISSGDDQFPQLINQTISSTGYIFTDVDGVLDEGNNVIEIITKENIDQISFWGVENDVTGGMKAKITKLLDQITHPCTIRIANGKNINNLTTILTQGHGIGTKVIIT